MHNRVSTVVRSRAAEYRPRQDQVVGGRAIPGNGREHVTRDEQRFLTLFHQDAAFDESIASARSMDESIRIAGDRGFEVDAEAIRRAIRSQSPGDGELSDDELNGPSGGAIDSSWVAGY